MLALHPANATAYYIGGLLHKDLGEREEAIAYLERALDFGLGPEMKQNGRNAQELGRE